MKSIVYIVLLAGSMAGLNFCKTDSKSTSEESKNKDSSVVIAEPERTRTS
jgi:hypothetical protein